MITMPEPVPDPIGRPTELASGRLRYSRAKVAEGILGEESACMCIESVELVHRAPGLLELSGALGIHQVKSLKTRPAGYTMGNPTLPGKD